MTRVQRRQRIAGAAVVGAGAAFIWSGAPEAIAAAGAHLSLADVVVLLLVAAGGFAALFVSVLLLLGDLMKAHARGLARLDAHDSRRARAANRAAVAGAVSVGAMTTNEARRVLLSPARLALTTDRRTS